MKRSFVVAGAVLGLALLSGAASAQATFGADAGVSSHYIWRGLTLVSKPVLQPDAYITFPAGKASVTIGGWANFELGEYSGADDVSESGGEGAFDLSEFDWWVEATIPAGTTSLTFGATGYIYPNETGFTSDLNTTELYGKVAFTNVLNPKLAVWYDFSYVKGAYAEGSISYPWEISDTRTYTFGALIGMSAGQEINSSDASEGYNFNKSGLTHADLSISTSFAVGDMSIVPQLHFLLPFDDLTKIATPSKLDESFKLWFGATLSWSRELGAK